MQSKAEYIAEILLGVFAEGLLAKLRSIVIEQHISSELGFKEGLIDLLILLTQIQLVLNDAEKIQASDNFVRSWLAELRRVAYDIDVVLDEFGYNILQQKVLNYSSPSNDIINMANKIKTINESLNRLKGDIASYDLRAEFVNSIPEISFNMEIDSFLDDSKCEEVPTLGQLPCLRVLEINHMDKVRSIGSKFYNCDGSYRNTTTLFPALRILELLSMSSLEEWKDAKELTSAGEVLLVFPCLEELIIRDCHKLGDLPGVPSVIQHMEIIRCGIDELPSGLQFCTSLQYLKIEECPNLKSIPESLHTCVSLQNFVVKDCPELRSLLDVPSVIQHLEIIRCGIDELTSGLQSCASLQYLKIEECPNLKSIPESLHTCVTLQKFEVENCPELRSLPGVPSVIQQLEIIRCGIDELPSGLQSCASLQYLKIESCWNLKSILESLHTCVSLQKFVVGNCPELRSLPGVPSVIQQLEIIRCGIDELPSELQFCTSLQYLKIEGCRNLKSIPDLGEVFHSLINLKSGNCPGLRLELRREGRLKTLVIGGFIEELDAFPILRYPSIRSSHASLKKLVLLGRPTLNSLPNEIQLFTALEELLIKNFNGMKALPDWLSYLSSLQKLSLYYCKKLMYLPILNLTNLKHLHIDKCRNLKKRCAEGSGVEWFQIAHVPNIRIDGEYIKRGEDSEYSDKFDSFDREYQEFDVFDDDDYVSEDEVDDEVDDFEDDSYYKYIPFPTGPQFIYVIFYFYKGYS
ncbi:disease resistance protein tao1 [Quercus suber]|uniref:Disease resistance protein tao1 n=1 Tax=Quercus suber TaxID=58331 RepID=A0AAW0K1Q1_QUESU